MAAAIYNTANKEGVDINAVFILDPQGTPEYPAPPFNVGDQAWGTDGSNWVYATASITIAAGSAVILSGTPGNWSAALLSNSTGLTKLGSLVGVVGGSQGSMVVPAPSGTQTGTFFWVQRAGNVPKLLTAASLNANVLLHTSAVGGLVGASVQSVSAQIAGLVFSQTAAASATAYNAIANFASVGINDV